jgi:hypothetical protein
MATRKKAEETVPPASGERCANCQPAGYRTTSAAANVDHYCGTLRRSGVSRRRGPGAGRVTPRSKFELDT